MLCARYRRRVQPPAVDVVIDSFDYGRFLAAAIDSALSQTHANTRVTVVDDGSSDDSLEVAGAYGERIGVIAKANGGQASALNAGFAATEGEFVTFLDADDVLCADYAAAAVQALSSQAAAVKAVFRARVIDEAGVPTGRMEPSPHLPLSRGDLRAATLGNAFDLVWPPLSAQVFRRSALAHVMPIPEDDFRTLADWYLAHATSLLGDVVALERVGACYREHGANAYLVGRGETSLAQVRTGIVHEERTGRHLERIARAQGLVPPARVERSTATLARRLISLRLDPGAHPAPADRRGALWLEGLRSVGRRRDLALRVRVALAAWLGLMAIAPRPLAPRLATVFLQPARRGRIARALATRAG